MTSAFVKSFIFFRPTTVAEEVLSGVWAEGVGGRVAEENSSYSVVFRDEWPIAKMAALLL